MLDLITYVPTIASTIIASGVFFGGLFWMIRLVIKVELIPLNAEIANIRNEIKDSENRLEQRLTRLETLIEGIRDKQ